MRDKILHIYISCRYCLFNNKEIFNKLQVSSGKAYWPGQRLLLASGSNKILIQKIDTVYQIDKFLLCS